MMVKTKQEAAIATWIAVETGNDNWWRAEAPAAAVGGKAIILPVKTAERALTAPNTDTDFPWSIETVDTEGKTHRINTEKGWRRYAKPGRLLLSLVAEYPKVEGAVVFSRPGLARATLAKSMRVHNEMRTIGETDDNYFADVNMNLTLRHMQVDKEMRMDFAKAMASMDACIFSTKWLRDRYYKEFRRCFGKKGLPDSYVCQNHIDADQWPERIPPTGPVRVGFMGSVSHLWDVNIAYASFKLAKDLGCETHMIGYNPANPDPMIPDSIEQDGKVYNLRSEKSVENIRKWGSVIDKHTPWIEPNEYHRAALPLDIGLCPLRTDDFTMGKSDVKAIEYTISGAAVICTNNVVYNKTWKHEETCLMVNSYVEMAEAVRRLVRDPKLRFELVTAAQEYVLKERGLAQMREEWSYAIEG